MNRERWIGLAVVLVVVGGFLLLRNRQQNKPLDDKAVTGEGVEIEERASEFAKQMGVTIPVDVQKAELKDATGGIGTGFGTRKYAGGTFTHSVLAGLPDLEKGAWYEAWLVRNEPFDAVYIGKLRMAKGGWVRDYTGSLDLTPIPKVMVTREQVDDRKPEVTVLEGSF